MDIEEIFNKKLEAKVKALYLSGVDNLSDIVRKSDGADPLLLEPIFNTLKKLKEQELENPRNEKDEEELDKSNYLIEAYKEKFFHKLPAANPLHFQWWFTLSSQENIATKILELGVDRVATIGAPTVASVLASKNQPVALFDIDIDIINLYTKVFCNDNRSLNKDFHAYKYDVAEDLPEGLGGFGAVFIDPPWYEEYLYKFINRSIELCDIGGIVFCALPKLLTRATAAQEREVLMKSLFDHGHKIISLESSICKYIVPQFEENVLKEELIDKINLPWRSGDLLIFESSGKKLPEKYKLQPCRTKVFSYKNQENIFRVFTSGDNIKCGVPIKEVPGFSKTFSRQVEQRPFNFWTSEKKAYAVGDIELFNSILVLWSEGNNLRDTAKALSTASLNEDSIYDIVESFSNLTGIWNYQEGFRKNPQRLFKDLKEKLSSYATQQATRPQEIKSDGYRIEFQRDRDRVIWSSGFKKLSNKTQLFPIDENSQLRQRLAHSIEVMQLAKTIGDSFGLDANLIEAGALAHDIGHTPFGHAGETALDSLMRTLGFDCGFNHYEHGVDVVWYLEGAYQNSSYSNSTGLNLTKEVCESIFKHTFCHGGNKGMSFENIYKNSKYNGQAGSVDIHICDDYCHLEGQAIRAADKISYLISDIEDGIALGILKLTDLLSCKLFHRAPIDFRHDRGHLSLLTTFMEQRPSIIRVLMEDIIAETSKRLFRLKDTTEKCVRNASDYVICHSPLIQDDVNEIWTKLQEELLHSNTRVLSANMSAAKR
jgi:dGTPase